MAPPGEQVHGKLSYYRNRILATPFRSVASLSGVFEQKRQAARIPASVTKSKIKIPSRDAGRLIEVEQYTPTDVRMCADNKKAVHISFHGSGFMINGLGDDTEFCARLAEVTGCVVMDCNYRKAPEYPYPLPQEDCDDVYSYLKSSAEYSSEHISISGFSAGANLAVGVACRLGPHIANCLVLFYGNSDMTKDYPAPNSKSDSGINIPLSVRQFFYNSYIGPTNKRDHPDFSPLFGDSNTFPKHVLGICGDCDQLHEPGRLLIEKLKNDGATDAEFLSVENCSHVFDKNVKSGTVAWDRKEEAYTTAFEFVKRVWDSDT